MMKNKQKKVVCTERLLFCWSRARFFPRYYFLALFSLFSHVLCYGLLCDKKSDFHTFFLDPSHCTQIKLTPSGQTFRNPDFHIDVEQFSDSIGDDEIEQKKNNFLCQIFPNFTHHWFGVGVWTMDYLRYLKIAENTIESAFRTRYEGKMNRTKNTNCNIYN